MEILSSYCWLPNASDIQNANVTHFMQSMGFKDLTDFHTWSAKNYESFWQKITTTLDIQFKQPYAAICDMSEGVENPTWFKGGMMNISDSCFIAKANDPAIFYLNDSHHIEHVTFGQLNQLSNQVANGLKEKGYQARDVFAIIMPMNYQAVAIYLGIIKMGGIVASIPDSFSPEEISVRLKISQAKLIFTQDFTLWNKKNLRIYDKVAHLNLDIVVISTIAKQNPHHRIWSEFLSTNQQFETVGCEPMAPCHILFSSGTTAEPKAILWNHTTPIKAASDAYFHQNIKAHDILAWPTNLGWMMGPWLIFAAFINKASLALYTEAPKDYVFGEFIQNAGVTMLGVVPTLVATWRQSACMEKVNWSKIKVFSSTGECSNAKDMEYLMQLAGCKPVIEYCGGTEIGGAYLSSTVAQPNYPSLFSTPTMGLAIEIIDQKGEEKSIGEVAIIPPSIGLSTQLLNADHHQIYYANMPQNKEGVLLRRHGDCVERLENGYYCVLGRTDDSMNLGGIKVSAAEIERTIVGVPGIIETAAIAVSHASGGPSLLIIYAVTQEVLDKERTLKTMQLRINNNLNPLFKIYDLIFCASLPKTASNKIMRRVLRKNYDSTIEKDNS